MGKSALPTVPGRPAQPRGTLCSFDLFILSAGGRPGSPSSTWPKVRVAIGRQSSVQRHNMSIQRNSLNIFFFSLPFHDLSCTNEEVLSKAVCWNPGATKNNSILNETLSLSGSKDTYKLFRNILKLHLFLSIGESIGEFQTYRLTLSTIGVELNILSSQI